MNGRDSLSRSVKPAVQTGHFVKKADCIVGTFIKAFLTARRLSIQITSIWAGCAFSLCCGACNETVTVPTNFSNSGPDIVRLHALSLLHPRSFHTRLDVGVNVCLRVAAPSVLHQSPTSSQVTASKCFPLQTFAEPPPQMGGLKTMGHLSAGLRA